MTKSPPKLRKKPTTVASDFSTPLIFTPVEEAKKFLGYEVVDGKAVKNYNTEFLDQSLALSLQRLRRSYVEDAEISLNAGAQVIEARYSLLRRDILDKYTGAETFPKTDQRSSWSRERFAAYRELAEGLKPLIEKCDGR
jgi:hypothetical protein